MFDIGVLGSMIETGGRGSGVQGNIPFVLEIFKRLYILYWYSLQTKARLI